MTFGSVQILCKVCTSIRNSSKIVTESRGLLMPDLELVCHADANSLVTIKLKPSSSKIVETGLSSLKAKENPAEPVSHAF